MSYRCCAGSPQPMRYAMSNGAELVPAAGVVVAELGAGLGTIEALPPHAARAASVTEETSPARGAPIRRAQVVRETTKPSGKALSRALKTDRLELSAPLAAVGMGIAES